MRKSKSKQEEAALLEYWKTTRSKSTGKEFNLISMLDNKELRAAARDRLETLDRIIDTIHKACKNGRIKQLSKELLTEEYLLLQNRDNATALHIATEFGHLDQIPKALLTQKNLLMQDCGGNTVFQIAARYRHLHTLPQELLTEENLTVKDMDGYTVFHVACPKQIPSALMTEANILRVSNNGSTALHCMAIVGGLNNVPRELLTEQNLRTQDNRGRTVLQTVFMEAAWYGRLDTIPRELFTEANLMITGEGTPLLAALVETRGYSKSKEEVLELLLGIEFSEAIIPIVGREWYDKNKQICRQKNTLNTAQTAPEVELF